MNTKIYENLNPQLRRSLANKAAKLSTVFAPQDSIAKRIVALDRFFKGYKGFTYKSFHDIFTQSIVLQGKQGRTTINPFRGFEGQFNVKIFGERKFSLDNEEETFDEYIETFFMYLCYQVFVKLFLRKEELFAKNAKNIKKANEILASVSATSMPNMVDGLTELYTLFYRSLIPSSINFNRVTPDEIYSYIEDFSNNNITLFTGYPLSSALSKITTDSVEEFISIIFELCGENTVLDIKDSRQISIIRLISSMIKNNNLDFDSGAIQEKIEKTPSIRTLQTQEINFSEKNQAVVNDIIETLYAFDDFSSIDMGWVKGTPWEPTVRFMFAILCTGELNKSIKEKSKPSGVVVGNWQKKLNDQDIDGGVYFINNNATLAALSEIDEFKSIKQNLSSFIKNVSSRVVYFQDLNGTALFDAMFAGKYEKSYQLQIVQDLGEADKNLIKNIFHISDLNFPTIEEGVTTINRTFFFNDIMPAQYMGNNSIVQFDRVLELAKESSANLEFNAITKSAIDAFRPTKIWDTVTRDIPSTISNAFSNFTETWNVVKLGQDLSKDFSYMSVEGDPGKGYFVIKDSSGTVVREMKTTEDLISYLITNCMAMGSVVCHGKIMFGNETLDKYFNTLSWLIKETETKFGAEKGRGVFAGNQFPLVYGITPFLVDYLKYSLRSFVNNVHKLEEVGDSLRKEIEESHTKSSMEKDAIEDLVSRLKAPIKSHLMKKIKTLQ